MKYYYIVSKYYTIFDGSIINETIGQIFRANKRLNAIKKYTDIYETAREYLIGYEFVSITELKKSEAKELKLI